jgi:type IV secretory pathway VirB9-like protein
MQLDRGNIRDALIDIAVGLTLVWALSGCAVQSETPPIPTPAQLAPMPEAMAPAAPKVTGATVLAEQSPEVQRAIEHGPPWLTFKWPRERLVPYTDHATPLTIDVAQYEAVDLSLPGEQIEGFALGDDERFIAAPIVAGNASHAILKCKVPNTETTGAIYSATRIYRVHLRCRDKTTVDAISYYYPDQVLAEMAAADATATRPAQPADPIAPTADASRINRAYKIDGPANIPWKPVAAMDDGTTTWIQLPRTTSPIAPVVSIDGGQTVNSRMRGQYIVVDALFNQAKLVSGNDRVTITRAAN